MTNRNHLALALLLTLPGCDSAPPPAPQEKGPPSTFPAGEYQVTALTEALRTTDRAGSRSVPSTRHKAGSTEVSRICSPVGPKPSAALFTDPGDTCSMSADYARDGRLSMAFECRRPGHGPLAVTLDGKYDEASFEVEVVTATRFSGPGDYSLSQRVKGKRIGDCATGKSAG
ncbi:MAG: DUF3617 family protein [Sphingomicrobium sp.]